MMPVSKPCRRLLGCCCDGCAREVLRVPHSAFPGEALRHSAAVAGQPLAQFRHAHQAIQRHHEIRALRGDAPRWRYGRRWRNLGAVARGDDRRAAGHGLNRRQRKAFVPGRTQHNVAFGVQPAQLVMTERAMESVRRQGIIGPDRDAGIRKRAIRSCPDSAASVRPSPERRPGSPSIFRGGNR